MQHKHAATYSTGKMHHQTNEFNGQRHPQHDVNQVDTVIRVISVWTRCHPEKMRKDEQK